MVLGTQYAGKKVENKLVELRKELDKKKSSAFIVCTSEAAPAAHTVLTSLSHAGRNRVAVQPSRK